MKCTKCGAELPQNFTFCPQCGASAGEEQNAAAPVASQPIAVQPAVDFSSEPTMAVNPAAQQPPVSSQPAASFPQQQPVSARPVNPYPPQPPVYGMPYGQPGPGVPGMPPQGMGMLPQLKSPFVKGAWFAPVSIAIYGVLVVLEGNVVTGIIARRNPSLLTTLNSIITTVLVFGFLALAIGLYFAAYAKVDPLQRKARFAVAFIPVAMLEILDELTGVVSSILTPLINSGRLRVELYAIGVGVVRLAMSIAAALASYFIVRALQKAMDKALEKKG